MNPQTKRSPPGRPPLLATTLAAAAAATTAISYKHKNKTMYLLSNKTIRPLNYGNLSCSLTSDDLKNFIKYASEKFTWIRNIAEDKKVHFFPFNNVMRYKLYNAKDMLKHSFKLPYPTIKNFLYNVQILLM
jgi:hypothetical protein